MKTPLEEKAVTGQDHCHMVHVSSTLSKCRIIVICSIVTTANLAREGEPDNRHSNQAREHYEFIRHEYNIDYSQFLNSPDHVQQEEGLPNEVYEVVNDHQSHHCSDLVGVVIPSCCISMLV